MVVFPMKDHLKYIQESTLKHHNKPVDYAPLKVMCRKPSPKRTFIATPEKTKYLFVATVLGLWLCRENVVGLPKMNWVL